MKCIGLGLHADKVQVHLRVFQPDAPDLPVVETGNARQRAADENEDPTDDTCNHVVVTVIL